MADAIGEAVAQLQTDIANLRSLNTELRPAALDDFGVQAALRDLAERARGRGLEVDLTINLNYDHGRTAERHTSDVETAIYRIVQESLTNATRHGSATRAAVTIEEDQSAVRITIEDDGPGFDTGVKSPGFGLLGMHGRAEMLHGRSRSNPHPGGAPRS